MVIPTSSRPLASSAIELHIEELVLHGFPARDRRQIGAAIKQELQRLLASTNLADLPSRAIAVERLDAGALHLDATPRPHMVGERVAQRVYAKLPGAWTGAVGQNAGKGAAHV